VLLAAADLARLGSDAETRPTPVAAERVAADFRPAP